MSADSSLSGIMFVFTVILYLSPLFVLTINRLQYEISPCLCLSHHSLKTRYKVIFPYFLPTYQMLIIHPETMASYNEENSTIVPTGALIAFVEAALALVNSGLAYLPIEELEHISVHLEHAANLAARAARSHYSSRSQLPIYESANSGSQFSHPPNSPAPAPTPQRTRVTDTADINALETKVQSLSIQGTCNADPPTSVPTHFL